MKKFISSRKTRRFAALFFALLLIASNLCFAAADGDENNIAAEIEAKFNVFYTIIYVVLRLVGVGMAIWAIVQIVQAAMTHDQSQKLSSFLMLGFGIVLFFTEQIVGLLM